MMEENYIYYCNSTMLPPSGVYLRELDAMGLVFIIIATIMTFAMIIIYVEEWWFLHSNFEDWKSRDKINFLLGVYPVFAISACVTLYVPRASVGSDLIASLYLSLCLYQFFKTVTVHFGSRHTMYEKLSSSNTKLPLASPPCCCCCVCLPNLPIKMNTVRVLDWGIFQYTVFRPFIIYVATVVYHDNPNIFGKGHNTPVSFLAIGILNTISALTAIYCLSLVFRISAELLSQHNLGPKYRSLQLVLIFFNMQGIPFSFMLQFGVFPCMPPLNASGVADRILHFLLVVEMMALSIMARIYYRSRIVYFNKGSKYLGRRASAPSMATHIEDTADGVQNDDNRRATLPHITYSVPGHSINGRSSQDYTLERLAVVADESLEVDTTSLDGIINDSFHGAEHK